MTLPLPDLLAALPHATVHGDPAVVVRAIVSDSRRAEPGSLFVAYRGVMVDGHDYIPQAVACGATAVVAERQVADLPVPLVVVPDGREALAYLSAAWFGFPARRLIVVGITGTDGKTTTSNLLHTILTAAGRRAGLVTTVNAVIGGRVLDTGLHTTTPDAPDVQRYLAEMVDAGLEIAILESTSHGLAQHRVTACDLDVAVVTNVTHEHLDIHGSLEAYRQAKAILFRHLATGARKAGPHGSGVPKVAVLNADDHSYTYLNQIPADRHLAYGLAGAQAHAQADVAAADIHSTPGGTRFTVHSPAGTFPLRTMLVGNYNVSNILAATSAALALDVPIEAIQAGVWAVRGIVGRMERIDEGQDFTAVVDFAHTPNALERALEAARTLTGGRVIAVFGCAGERDRQKRAWMGEIAGRLADVTVMTAEDPRTESLDTILDEMARGAHQAGAVEGESYHRVPDRAEAIQFAVDLAGPGDLVITLGKGHEQSMCYGTVETPWSEHDALRQALQRRGEDKGAL
ncbi:MAG: UDP-N-acetylmuramoyl-L-alanyl-D-glutamate--2,6-diaminopimelate ligase [Anaerolineae bacterium]|nr:UDP-N-acetylmuramoyl-L-alanyl-D-glutamate--2,6-diaminopimelate ligase [Anaerolineae bacterium]